MKTLAFALFAFCTVTLCRAANPSLENFDQLYFKTNAPAPGIIQTRMNTSQFRAPVLPGETWTITNVTGLTGASHWTNVAGVLQPVDGTSLLVTNLTATSNTVNVGTMTWLSKSIVLTNGVNYLPSGKYSQLQLISPSTDPSLVQIVLSNGWSTVQHLEIFNLTNAVPSQGAFTLTNLTPIPDSLGGGVVKLINNEDWVATNGCGIELRFISPDWVEQFRSDVSGSPTFISNTFNNITVISNTTLRGRITINNINVTTNTLWTTNTVAGVVNLQPVDLTEQPMVKNGWFVGTNSQTLWGSALGSDWALVSVADATKGEGGRGLSIASTDGNFSTNYSQITLSTVTNTAGLTLLSSDGSNDSVVSLQSQQATGGGGVLDIKFGGTNFVHIEPGITNGSPIAQFGSSITHSTGNIFELANNTTNRVVVTPLSTLIGSPVTSPNFSVPAALQVSNFEDRGKALTVDIKLGASGNNDDYPVYFYSQITNSSAHPTINMEEVSPSGYIGGAHTLLSVQETPKVTNTVSTWPTYAAASTTAGYFNAAPTGGTNGAAMGLQGSVDPTRNFINIGVGSYVEATTDNLAATNIAFSGTVNQVLGTQKAVGGLFEIGSLANIPSIPSSAGVLIDGHNSGAPLIIAQTNGAVQFKVAANSGYAGAGTTFLADDGTYKAAGAGGSTLWYSYTTTDAEGGTIYSTANTNTIGTGAFNFALSYLTNFNPVVDLSLSIGYPVIDIAARVAKENVSLFYYGVNSNNGEQLTNSYYIFNYGVLAGAGTQVDIQNSHGLMNYGIDVGSEVKVVNSHNNFNYGQGAGNFVNLTNTSNIYNYGRDAGNAMVVNNGDDIYSFGYSANFGLTGTGLTHIFVAGSSVTATNSNDWIAGDNAYNYKFPGASFIAASSIQGNGGFSSLGSDTGAITSTGWTNSIGKDADVAFDATTLIYKLADASGAFWYTNSVAVGQGFIHLQKGGKFVLVSGTGLTGQYHAH